MTELHKVPHAAERLTIKTATMWAWIGERKIGTVRIGRSVRVPESEIQRLIHDGFTPAREPRL